MELYWILRLPHLHDVFQNLGIFGIILSALSIFAFCMSLIPDEDVDMLREYRSTFLKVIPLTLICFFVTAMIPTKSDLALMYGWDALKSDTVQEVIEILRDKIK